MTDWFKNDDLFRRELVKGHRWATQVTERLNAEGIPAELTPFAWRDTIDDRHQFSDEADIVVPTRDGPLYLESKSRALRFTEDPGSYPYDTAFVDTVGGWNKKERPRFAVVLTSQMTEQMLVIPAKNSPRPEWTIKDAFDRVRQIPNRWYETPASSLLPFSHLVEALRTRL
jgi:hypothetical protein